MPPGEQTASFIAPGWVPVAMYSAPTPSTIFAASRYAVARCSPYCTPASPSASMYMSVKAGAQPATTMAMVMCAVSTRSISEIGPNSDSKTSVCMSVSVLSVSVTSTPLPTAIGVFGIVHWIWML